MSGELDPKVVRELQVLVDAATSPKNVAECVAGVYGVLLAIGQVGSTTGCDPAVLLREVFGEEAFAWSAEFVAHVVAEAERTERDGHQ